jgi:hypothetical protein
MKKKKEKRNPLFISISLFLNYKITKQKNNNKKNKIKINFK